MGRKHLNKKESGRPRDSKPEDAAQVEKATVRRHFVPALIQQYRRSVMSELATLLPTAPKRNGTLTPFKILLLKRKGMADSVQLKGFVAKCKSGSAPKMSSTLTEPLKNCTPPRAKTIERSQEAGGWRVTLASNHAEVVHVQNDPVPDGGRSRSPRVARQGEGAEGPDVVRPSQCASEKTKKHILRDEGEIDRTGGLVQTGLGGTDNGPCTRSRSGRTRSASGALAQTTGARFSTARLEIEAVERKKRQTGTALRSWRKRGSREAELKSNCEYPSLSFDTELQETVTPGRKRRRLTQCTKFSSLPDRTVETTDACLPASNTAVGGEEGSPELCASQYTAPQRRYPSGRRRQAKRRGSQASPEQKGETAHIHVVQTSPETAQLPSQTRLPCFLNWPNDPTRPSCESAIVFEPADLRPGFDVTTEWPYAVTNAAVESPQCVSHTDEEPRYFLCGGLPHPPRSPPWCEKLTPSEGEARLGALPDSECLDKGAGTLRVATSARAASQCLGWSPDEPSPVYSAPFSISADQMETTGDTADAKLREDGQRQSSQMQSTDTTVHPTDTTEGGAEHDDEENDWIFTPFNPDRATAIVDYMGGTIRRLIATTEAVQRRTDTYSRICERLFGLNEPCQRASEEKTTEDIGDGMSPGQSSTTNKQQFPAFSGRHEIYGQATVVTHTQGPQDGDSRFQRHWAAQQELYSAKPTNLKQPTADQAAAVFSSGHLQSPEYLAQLELRLLRNPAFQKDEFAHLCLQLLKKYGKNKVWLPAAF